MRLLHHRGKHVYAGRMTIGQITAEAKPMRRYHHLPEDACPYLEGQKERKCVTLLEGPDAAKDMGELTLRGYRRMSDVAFIPRCHTCQACLSLRIPVQEFAPSRQQRRVLRSLRDLTCRSSAQCATLEQYQLFQKYQIARHPFGSMRDIDFDAYSNIVEQNPIPTDVLEFRTSEGKLVCVSLIDIIPCGISAVYTFYDPENMRRSYGIYAILKLISLTHQRQLPHLYLGNWVAQSPKMAYKSAFRPAEIFQFNKWRRLDTTS